jgi:chromosome segregation ATPase
LSALGGDCSQEDYDGAEQLNDAVGQLELKAQQAQASLQEAAAESERVEEALRAARNQQACEAAKVGSQLQVLLEAHQLESSGQEVGEADAALAQEAKRLEGERERLEAEKSHVQRDRSNLEEEQRQTEEQIGAQTKELTTEQSRVGLELLEVEGTVARLKQELGQALKAKESLEAKLASSEEAVQTVR